MDNSEQHLMYMVSKYKHYTLRKLKKSLNSLTSRTTAVLQWIPAHTGIHGNEMADQLAKEGSKKQQPKSKLSYQEANTLQAQKWRP